MTARCAHRAHRQGSDYHRSKYESLSLSLSFLFSPWVAMGKDSGYYVPSCKTRGKFVSERLESFVDRGASYFQFIFKKKKRKEKEKKGKKARRVPVFAACCPPNETFSETFLSDISAIFYPALASIVARLKITNNIHVAGLINLIHLLAV